MLIGITGKSGSGKDEVGDILRTKYNFAVTTFAYPIVKAVCDMLEVSIDKWDDRAWRNEPQPVYEVTPRHMVQTLGTEWGRHNIKGTIWVDLAMARLDALPEKHIAVTDVRFRNEADRIRSDDYDGHIIHVHRAELEADSTPEHRKHESELGIGLPLTDDFHINNFGTLKNLETQVDQVVARILELQQDTLEQEEETQLDEEV